MARAIEIQLLRVPVCRARGTAVHAWSSHIARVRINRVWLLTEISRLWPFMLECVESFEYYFIVRCLFFFAFSLDEKNF